jgi:lipoprotein-releasing system permease protein
MLVIEKKDNLKTLSALGAKEHQVRNIFFFGGLLINIIGLFLGLLLGYGICFLQQQVGFIEMQNSTVNFFPILFKSADFVLILSITLLIGSLAAYLPSQFLTKRIIKS